MNALTSILNSKLEIAGVEPFSLVDYPGKSCITIFTQGCHWDCGYCHNEDLRPFQDGQISWKTVETLMKRRVGLVGAVVFSGGEPLLQTGLLFAALEASHYGYSVGLHTTGLHTAKLKDALSSDLFDWIGIDYKHSVDKYSTITNDYRNQGGKVLDSIWVLKDSGIEFEVRTTVDASKHQLSDLLKMYQELEDIGVINWVLQPRRLPNLKLCNESVEIAELAAEMLGVPVRK